MPTPENLERAARLDGHPVILADGAAWLVPVARGLTPEDGQMCYYNRLPQVAGLDDAGRWTTGGIVPHYRRLWDLAGKWWDARYAGDVKENPDGTATAELDGFDTLADIFDAATEVLQANYRIGKPEVATLGILTAPHARAVLDALIDGPTMAAWQKKTLADGGLNSSGGPTG